MQYRGTIILCFSTYRGFVWGTHESGPIDHQRSRNVDARRDAYLTTELWVMHQTCSKLLIADYCLYILFFDFSPFLNGSNIFLGETFSSYISVHNDSNQVVKDILVKVLLNYLSTMCITLSRIFPFHHIIIIIPLCNVTFSRLTYRPAHRDSTSRRQTPQWQSSNLNAALMMSSTMKSKKSEHTCECFFLS